MIDITAQQAKELANLPTRAAKISEAIKVAAKKGENGVHVRGEIPWEIHNELSKKGFCMTWIGCDNVTWIWWGS